MKDDRGFTLIELIVAIAILSLISVVIFKAFLVSTKVNIKSYEKDKANIAVINKMEEIKKNPCDFIKMHEDKTETRCYTSLFNGAYYYYLRNDGTLDDKPFEEYVESYFKVFPRDPGWNIVGENPANGARAAAFKNSSKNKYNIKNTSYYDRAGVGQLQKSNNANLFNIKCIVNKCSTTEYYDSNWNITEEAKAKYEAQINISRRAENHVRNAYEPETLLAKDRYDVPEVPFNEKYQAILTKEDGRYVFSVFYSDNSEDLKSGNTHTCPSPSRFILPIEEEKTSVPVRIDFNNSSNKPMYNVEVSNMTDKLMELYIVHNGANNSEVIVKVNKGEVNKREVYTTKNFAKAAYKIDVKVIRKEDNYNLINYNTEKYLSGEDAQDFNFANR